MPSLFKYGLAGAAALSSMVGLASAEQVQLFVPNSNITLEGELVSFDGENYVLRTSLGTFELPASAVQCRGDDCPELKIDMTATIAVTDDASRDLAVALIQGLATRNNLEVRPGDDGSVTMYDIEGNPQGTIDMTALPMDRALTALSSGDVSLIMSDATLTAAESEVVKISTGIDFLSPENNRIAALEAYAPLVGRANPVKLISLFDMADIVSGRITNWQQLGGPNRPIRVILPSEANPEFKYFQDTVLTPYRIRLAEGFERMDDPVAIAQAVAQDPLAITFGSTTRGNVTPIAVQRSCGLLANTSPFQVQAEEYPFTRRLHVYGDGSNQTPGAKALFDYSISQDSGEYVSFTGLFPPSIYVEPLSQQGGRVAGAITAATQIEEFRAIQDLVDDLSDASRVSTAFRFVSGSARLDSKAAQDLELIVDYLIEEGPSVKEVLLVGYTDNIGRPDMNTQLALSRANFVRDALVEAAAGRLDPEMFKTFSYGPLAPVDCNDTVEGRASNRRVEVWVR